jgi:hypothetical protein
VTNQRRGCGCGSCFTAFVFVAILGAVYTYLLTGNGRWVTLGAAALFVAYRVARALRKRRLRRFEEAQRKTSEIAKGAVWAAMRPNEEDRDG